MDLRHPWGHDPMERTPKTGPFWKVKEDFFMSAWAHYRGSRFSAAVLFCSVIEGNGSRLPRSPSSCKHEEQAQVHQATMSCILCCGHGAAQELASCVWLLFVVLSGFHKDPV